MVVGAGTEVIAGEGMILTAGGYDSHIHFICPQQIERALASGVTTMTGGGTGPANWDQCYYMYTGSLEYWQDVTGSG